MFPVNGQVPFTANYYSVNLNAAHLITFSADMLSADLLYAKNGAYNLNLTLSLDAQLDWLEDDLKQANANRRAVPWLIVFLAKSIDCEHLVCHTNKIDYLKKRLENLFFEYDVDLVFESSENVYERTYPTVKHVHKYQLNYDHAEMPVRISLPKYKREENATKDFQLPSGRKLRYFKLFT